MNVEHLKKWNKMSFSQFCATVTEDKRSNYDQKQMSHEWYGNFNDVRKMKINLQTLT